MKKNIICVGELLIDFICSDIDTKLSRGVNFIKKAGGAPANVTASISKLGGSASFIGKVGKDPFGYFLKTTLDEAGVDTSIMVMDPMTPTTLAFVSLQANGERDFIFNRGADELLYPEDVDIESVKKAGILHFGSATALLGGATKETYLKLIEDAHAQGKFISFDPNYRDALWGEDTQGFVEQCKICLKFSDFVKVSEEELEIISGAANKEEALKRLHQMGGKIIAVTLGSSGTLISKGEERRVVPTIKIKSIDSTGAGDAFVGAVLYKLSERQDISKLSFEDLGEIISFGNKVGAIVCTSMGAISSLPTLEEVKSFTGGA